MKINNLIKTALHCALESAEKNNQIGTKIISFSSKALLKQFPDLGPFSDEPLYMALEELVQKQSWAMAIKPDSLDLVAGLATIKLKIDLSCFDDIAEFFDYTKLEDRADQQWLKFNASLNLSFSQFRWKKWGNSVESAARNIEQAIKMLATSQYSQHQLSAILVNNAKQLEEKDMDHLLALKPELEENLRIRRVILNYHCMISPQCCLIVENMDTYYYLREFAPADWMLVCGFGQRITKKNIRDLSVVDLHASADTPLTVQQACRQFWSQNAHGFLYWGDKDTNGEQIFQTLNKQITSLEKWLPAYNAMQQIADQHQCNDVHQEAVHASQLF